MVFRLLAGLGAAGRRARADDARRRRALERRCDRHCSRRARGDTPLPELEELEMPLDRHRARHDARGRGDVSRAGVRAIVVLGGDGTHRVVAKALRRRAAVRALHRHEQRVPGDARGDGRRARRRARGHRARRAVRAPPRARAARASVDGAGPRARRRRRDHASASSAPARCGGSTRRHRAVRDPSRARAPSACRRSPGCSRRSRGAAPGCTCSSATGDADRCTVPLAPGLITAVGIAEHRAAGARRSRWTWLQRGAASRSTASARSSAPGDDRQVRLDRRPAADRHRRGHARSRRAAATSAE